MTRYAAQDALSIAQKAARARIKAGEGFMYVVAIEGTDILKIGFSLRPERRVRGLSYLGMPRLLGFFPATLLQEKAFHRQFLKVRDKSLGRECYQRHVLRAAA